jgi:hypothetical protein
LAYGANEELGCPSEDECDDLKLSPNACKGCSRRVNGDDKLSDEIAAFIDYARYMLKKYEIWQMGLNVKLKGFEEKWLVAVHREVIRYRQEILDRRRKMDKKNKK